MLKSHDKGLCRLSQVGAIGKLAPMNEDQAAIGDQRERWISAINKGSAAGFVSTLTDDAIWLPPGRSAIRGKEKIKSWIESPFAQFDYDYSVKDVHLRIAGDWAIEQAGFSTRARKKSGEPMPVHEGRYTLLWRKTVGGIWLIERYIDHSADFVRVM